MIAGDAKWDIDENALYRHPEFTQFKDDAETDPIEAEAHRRGIQYVRLEGGDIGIIGNGAGLVMTTMDEVQRAGGKPADFLDIGGGAKAEAVTNSLDIVLSDPNVKGVLFNIFGGITRGDEVAKGIIEGVKNLDVKVPIVIRLGGHPRRGRSGTAQDDQSDSRRDDAGSRAEDRRARLWEKLRGPSDDRCSAAPGPRRRFGRRRRPARGH